MKNHLLSLFVFFIVVGTCNAQFGSLSKSSSDDSPYIKLGEIIPGLQSFEGNPEIDGIGKNVTYDKIDVDKYDQLFFEAAKANATVKQLKFFVTQSKKNPDFFVDGIGLQFKKIIIDLVNPDFSSTFLSNTTKLSSSLSSMNPSSDFTGFKATKIPGAISGIKKSIDNINSAVNELPEVVKSITEKK